jgi:hypothetical protein
MAAEGGGAEVLGALHTQFSGAKARGEGAGPHTRARVTIQLPGRRPPLVALAPGGLLVLPPPWVP